jgi:hypothetical protein
MKMQYGDEETFVMEEIEIPDEQYDVAKELHTMFGNYGPIIVRKDKKSVCFGVNKATDRVDREKGTNLHRITIEKV